MGKFIILSFLALGLLFYEMSGGADFEPELRAPVAVAQTELEPAPQPEVTRNDTASLIAISAPVQEAPVVAEPFARSAPIPAGEVVITPAPNASPVETVPVAAPVEDPVVDLRRVAGEWVNMRSGPSTDYTVLDTLPRGAEAEVLEVNADGWARIRITDTDQIGWMAERLLSDS